MAMNYPDRYAYFLAKKLRYLRQKSELPVYSELNPLAQQQMNEVIKQIDWVKFDQIIKQLEFAFQKRKGKC